MVPSLHFYYSTNCKKNAATQASFALIVYVFEVIIVDLWLWIMDTP